jgi:hypothetical protein
MKLFLAALAAGTITSATGLSAAQITQQATPREAPLERNSFVADSEKPDYKVTFSDDPLVAALNDGNLPRIQVRAIRGYGQLSRPRVQFVSEMLKSVEIL